FQLTEDVVNRMKEGKRDNQRSPRASNGTAPSSLAAEGKPRPTGTVGAVLPMCVTEDACVFHYYLQEQALVHEELLRLAKREREAASEARERNNINEERQRTAQ
ncbi:MIC25 protein, partial [Grantiella picta]|nr:MIC25 protein [Grantiella picta]